MIFLLEASLTVRIQIALDIPVFRALRSLADEEFRDPRAQASIIIFKELQRRGLLPVADSKQVPAGVENERTDQR